MPKHYLVPYTGDGKTPQTAFRPKYLKEMGIVYSAMDFPDKQMFLVVADCRNPETLNELENYADVIPLNANNKAIRDKVAGKMKLTPNTTEDIALRIARSKHPNFSHNNFKANP